MKEITLYIRGKKNKPCHHCKKTFHFSALQYHHVDRATKEFALSDASSMEKSYDQIDEELDKCVLVCAVCHATTTYAEDHALDEESFFAENGMQFSPYAELAAPKPNLFWIRVKKWLVSFLC